MMGEDISRRHGGNRGTIVTAAERRVKEKKRMKKENPAKEWENGKIQGMTKG